MNSAKQKNIKSLVIVLVIIAIGIFGFMQMRKWHTSQLDAARTLSQNECLEIIERLENDLEALRNKAAAEEHADVSEEQLPDILKESGFAEVSGILNCDKTGDQMRSFFRYLDKRPYIASKALDGGVEAFFSQCISLLMAAPPINTAEMEDIFRLINNVTHFYRVLGKKRLLLAKDILVNENRTIEPAAAVFYAFFVECGKTLKGGSNPLPIERLYDYAGFFLNTLGGRSYLLRRESKVRMLISYYAILIVDKANDGKFNSHGIDVRPYIDFLFYDINNQKGLAYRERYLTQLTTLRDKYLL